MMNNINISIGDEDLSTWVQSLLERWHVPDLTLGVLKNDEIIYSNALGWADIENKIPPTQETLIPIGSLTKLFISNVVKHRK